MFERARMFLKASCKRLIQKKTTVPLRLLLIPYLETDVQFKVTGIKRHAALVRWWLEKYCHGLNNCVKHVKKIWHYLKKDPAKMKALEWKMKRHTWGFQKDPAQTWWNIQLLCQWKQKRKLCLTKQFQTENFSTSFLKKMEGPHVVKPGFGVEGDDFVPLLLGGGVSEKSLSENRDCWMQRTATKTSESSIEENVTLSDRSILDSCIWSFPECNVFMANAA